MEDPTENPRDALLGCMLKGAVGFPCPPKGRKWCIPQEMHVANSNLGGGNSYPPEPSIGNVEIWAGLASLPDGYPKMVGRTHCHS